MHFGVDVEIQFSQVLDQYNEQHMVSTIAVSSSSSTFHPLSYSLMHYPSPLKPQGLLQLLQLLNPVAVKSSNQDSSETHCGDVASEEGSDQEFQTFSLPTCRFEKQQRNHHLANINEICCGLVTVEGNELHNDPYYRETRHGRFAGEGNDHGNNLLLPAQLK
ncbi:hypothetical protein Q3G72_019895 [Acer saccharum]|nr:hypothetical protein Q3G72_019895 [Acer saccharum]